VFVFDSRVVSLFADAHTHTQTNIQPHSTLNFLLHSLESVKHFLQGPPSNVRTPRNKRVKSLQHVHTHTHTHTNTHACEAEGDRSGVFIFLLGAVMATGNFFPLPLFPFPPLTPRLLLLPPLPPSFFSSTFFCLWPSGRRLTTMTSSGFSSTYGMSSRVTAATRGEGWKPGVGRTEWTEGKKKKGKVLLAWDGPGGNELEVYGRKSELQTRIERLFVGLGVVRHRGRGGWQEEYRLHLTQLLPRNAANRIIQRIKYANKFLKTYFKLCFENPEGRGYIKLRRRSETHN